MENGPSKRLLLLIASLILVAMIAGILMDRFIMIPFETAVPKDCQKLTAQGLVQKGDTASSSGDYQTAFKAYKKTVDCFSSSPDEDDWSSVEIAQEKAAGCDCELQRKKAGGTRLPSLNPKTLSQEIIKTIQEKNKELLASRFDCFGVAGALYSEYERTEGIDVANILTRGDFNSHLQEEQSGDTYFTSILQGNSDLGPVRLIFCKKGEHWIWKGVISGQDTVSTPEESFSPDSICEY